MPLLLLVACDQGGVDANLGARALVFVGGAQFIPGPMPAASNGAPAVVDIITRNHAAFPGERGKKLNGHLDPSGRGIAIGFAGDIGYWVVPAGNPDEVEANLLTFAATIDLSTAIPAGNHDLLFAAVDAQGHFGAPMPLSLTIASATPQGLLIVTLKWDTESDLDLHVVEPDGTEVWARNINDYTPPGPGEPTPDAGVIAGGGILDFDSNSMCQIDGRRQEDVTYATAVPSGHYIVRVETFSLCATAYANWTVDVISQGEAIAHARGESTDADVQLPHGAGAGTTAVEFVIP
jgi:hypothetical protein